MSTLKAISPTDAAELMRKGADRKRLLAKAFGAAAVDRTLTSTVAEQNGTFIRDFLARENIPLVAERLGGTEAREVYMRTDNGEAHVRRIAQAQVEQLAQTELEAWRRLSLPPPAKAWNPERGCPHPQHVARPECMEQTNSEFALSGLAACCGLGTIRAPSETRPLTGRDGPPGRPRWRFPIFGQRSLSETARQNLESAGGDAAAQRPYPVKSSSPRLHRGI